MDGGEEDTVRVYQAYHGNFYGCRGENLVDGSESGRVDSFIGFVLLDAFFNQTGHGDHGQGVLAEKPVHIGLLLRSILLCN